MNDNNVQNGSGAQEEPQGWERQLVEAYGNAMWTWALEGTLENRDRAIQAKQDLFQAIQAAQATARAEEDDFMTVRDSAAMAALPYFLACRSIPDACEESFDTAEAFMAARSRRQGGANHVG